MGLDIGQTLPLLGLLNYPGDRFAQGLAKHGATGLADGRQACLSPFLRTVVPQLGHQGAVRQEYEIHMPGLALATPELTRAHAQMLLAVPMEGLGSCPAFAIGLEDAMHFPIGAVGDDHLAWFCISLSFPQHHNPHRVRHTWNADTFGEIPLLFAVNGRFAPTQRPQLRFDPLTRLPILAIDRDRAIELQITDIRALLTVDMIEDLGIGEVAVKGEIARYSLLDHPIDQLLAEYGVILEGLACGDATLLLTKAPKLQRVVLEGGADIVGDQVIVGDQMALVGMIPEPAGIFNQLAVMVDQGIINRDHAVRGVVGGRVALQPFEAPLVERLFIPVDLGDPAVQTGLVGRDRKLSVDAADGFAFGDEETSQILSEVPALRFVGN